MHSNRLSGRRTRGASLQLLHALFVVLASGLISNGAWAQPVPLSPAQLDQLVARIALYPDPLLAQVLTASTSWTQIPEAAVWADQHSYLTGDALATAIREDNLEWDPSVLALLPFPSILHMMASDPAWLEQLGNAVLTQRADVMDAIQRMRRRAMNYGYLQSSSYINVVPSGNYIEILPAAPGVLYVPDYDPFVVFAPPPAGFVIGGAIRFGPGIVIGGAFAPWGWAAPGFLWSSHAIIIDRHPWERLWVNRGAYLHPYAHPWVRTVGPRIERHAFGRR